MFLVTCQTVPERRGAPSSPGDTAKERLWLLFWLKFRSQQLTRGKRRTPSPHSSILTVHSPPSPSRLYPTVLLLIGRDDRVFLLRLQRLIPHARMAGITVWSRYETREEICHHFLSTWNSFFSSQRGECVASLRSKRDLFAKRLRRGQRSSSSS